MTRCRFPDVRQLRKAAPPWNEHDPSPAGTRSIGIEHEGWVDRPVYFTDALYESSARLTASVRDRYGIPKDRTHVIGHHEVPGSDHTDPGPHREWSRYLRLVDRTWREPDGRGAPASG